MVKIMAPYVSWAIYIVSLYLYSITYKYTSTLHYLLLGPISSLHTHIYICMYTDVFLYFGVKVLFERGFVVCSRRWAASNPRIPGLQGGMTEALTL